MAKTFDLGNNIKLEVDENMIQKSVDDSIKFLQNHVTNNYMNVLIAISKDYQKTVIACDKMKDALVKYSQTNDNSEKFHQLKPLSEIFNGMQAQISLQVKAKHIEIPPIPTTMKAQLTADEYKDLEATHKRLSDTKLAVGKYSNSIKTVFIKIGDHWKAKQKQFREERDGAVQPAPAAANGPPQPIPSFMHSNQSSQQKAADANRPSGIPGVKSDQSAKK